MKWKEQVQKSPGMIVLTKVANQREGKKTLNLILQLGLWLPFCILFSTNQSNSGSVGFKPFSLWLVVQQKKKEMASCHKHYSNIKFVFLSSQTLRYDVNLEEHKWHWKLRTCLLNSNGTSGRWYWESPWPVKHSDLQKHQISLKRKRRISGSFE